MGEFWTLSSTGLTVKVIDAPSPQQRSELERRWARNRPPAIVIAAVQLFDQATEAFMNASHACLDSTQKIKSASTSCLDSAASQWSRPIPSSARRMIPVKVAPARVAQAHAQTPAQMVPVPATQTPLAPPVATSKNDDGLWSNAPEPRPTCISCMRGAAASGATAPADKDRYTCLSARQTCIHGAAYEREQLRSAGMPSGPKVCDLASLSSCDLVSLSSGEAVAAAASVGAAGGVTAEADSRWSDMSAPRPTCIAAGRPRWSCAASSDDPGRWSNASTSSLAPGQTRPRWSNASTTCSLAAAPTPSPAAAAFSA